MTVVFGMPLPALLGQLTLGLVNGCFYALLSLGLAVIFGMLNIINFAHGAMYTLGAFAASLFLGAVTVGAPAARAAEAVTVGTVGQASANLWPVFIALDKGFFAAEDLKVDVVYVQSSAQLVQQITAGSLDICISTGLVDAPSAFRYCAFPSASFAPHSMCQSSARAVRAVRQKEYSERTALATFLRL